MIYLDFGGTEIGVNLRYESTFRSKHTGAELRHIEVSVVASNREEHEKLLENIHSAKKYGMNSTDGQGTVLDRWKVKNTSYSYTNSISSSGYYHSLELEETENLSVDSLTLGGLNLHPYSYDEQFEGDVLNIKAKVLLSEIQYVELRELMKTTGYFPVIRHGISDEPREMRFGQTLWSKHEDGIKHALLLIDKSYDDTSERFRGLFVPEIYRMQDMIAEHVEILEELITTLICKGLIETNEANDIRTSALERLWDRQREFYRVEDLDNY